MSTSRPSTTGVAPGGGLERLLFPGRVAVVGGAEAEIVLRACQRIGFAGELWPVSPRRREMAGIACVATLGDLPGVPDAAFLAVPAEATIGLVAELAAMGAGGAVCYAAGFAESGPDGTELQRVLVKAAGSMPVLGPNCYGYVNYLDRIALWPDHFGGEVLESGCAFLSQSGNIAMNVTMQQRSVPLAMVISLGNQATISLGDCIDALLDDGRIKAVGLYMEGIDNLERFQKAAARALEAGVPLVVLRAGKSASGAAIALGHTAALSGGEEATRAFFERHCIIEVESLDDLLETMKLLSLAGGPLGRRVLSLSCSGGEAAMVADLGERHGLSFPSIPEAARRDLAGILPPFVRLENPLDYNTTIWGDFAAERRCFATALRGEVDLGLLVLDFPLEAEVPAHATAETTMEAFIAACRDSGRRGAVASSLPELFPKDMRERALRAGVTPLLGIGAAVRAIAAAGGYAERRLRLLGRARPAPWPALRRRAKPANRSVLDEWESKQRLARFGLAVPEGAVTTIGRAPEAAAEIGFPVAVKALAPGLAHKSELGVVRLGLADRGSVADACAAVECAMTRFDAWQGKVLVERMASGPVGEVILGVKRAEPIGFVLVAGSGGVLTELLGDSRTLLLPADRDEVRSALDSLRVARLIDGYRGASRGDLEAVVDAAMALAEFARTNADTLLEVEINPLIVLPDGALAVDALICLAGE